MTLDELETLCREAARDLAAREGRPLPAAVVLPLAEATRVLTLPDFPEDDLGRYELLDRLAHEQVREENAPCYGFLAEAEVANAEGEPVDVVVCAYGARRQRPQITAAVLHENGELGEWLGTEALDPSAMPFLSPLQRAVDAAQPPESGGPLGGSRIGA